MPKIKVPNTKSCVETETVHAGPSGLQIVPVSESESESETASEIAEEEKCCVCHKFTPEELKQCVSLVITKWAKCDVPLCQHWTHLIYFANKEWSGDMTCFHVPAIHHQKKNYFQMLKKCK